MINTHCKNRSKKKTLRSRLIARLCRNRREWYSPWVVERVHGDCRRKIKVITDSQCVENGVRRFLLSKSIPKYRRGIESSVWGLPPSLGTFAPQVRPQEARRPRGDHPPAERQEGLQPCSGEKSKLKVLFKDLLLILSIRLLTSFSLFPCSHRRPLMPRIRFR